MEFRILGPLEVFEGARPVPLAGRPRALLAFFLLHPNQVVSSDRLIDALWGERPPETAQAALQVHVSQLRKSLGAERIKTRAPGYVFSLGPDQLDAPRFEALLAAGDLAGALSLWRGSALADFQYEPWAQGEIARLDELRLSALEERADEDLRRGEHGQLVSELEGLVREHPFRERLRAHLMVALYRCGRQAEALAVYQETRRSFVEELGIEPGPELQQLHKQLLNQDPALAAPVAAEPEQPAPVTREERKIVTVLFCDLVGFTSRAEELDPEDVSALLSRYHLRLRAELERFGGTVEKFVGDAVLALFGAPVAHEDDPERAVRAALGIRDWIAEVEDDLQVRIGIATGEALVRLGAQPVEGEAMAVGNVVNTAARLQQTAPEGGVIVDAATYRATRSRIAYDRHERIALKGKAQPVSVWLAHEAQSLPGLMFPTEVTPFIGRSDDLALLRQTYARALRESSVQLATIVGEPGIGKTRLLGEFHSFVDDQAAGVRWLQGRCLAYGDGITFWALGQIVKDYAGILESDTAEAASAKLMTVVDVVGAEQDRLWLYSQLAPLVGAAAREQAVQEGEAAAAWRTFLEGIAAREPLVLAIEDLHWADTALLGFVDQLMDWSTDVPLMVVCTARPELYERESGWGGGKRNSTTITLGPLTSDETVRLVSELLSDAPLPPDTETALLERAGGNPLYAEEFVRMLDDRGLLTGDGGALQVASKADITVPESVQAVIAARLDTLSEDRKELLQDAAVVGKVFWAGALSSIGRTPKESVLAGLHELARREFIRRARVSSIADDVEYVFWHVLVRDVAYAQIPRALRARKHTGAAEWIERIAGERVSDHAEFLANHYATALELVRASGDEGQAKPLLDAAVRFGVLAAVRAIRLDQTQGERYYRRTLALLAEDDPRRAKLLADAADAGIFAGRPVEQIKPELEEAIAKLLAQGNRVAAANAMRQLSFLLWRAGASNESRLALADEARRLLEREPEGPEIALVYARIAQEHMLAFRFRDTISWAEKALLLLERFGLDDDALGTRSRVALSRCILGDLGGMEQLREIACEAVRPERAYGTFAVHVALINVGTTEVWFGDGPAAGAVSMRAAQELAAKRGLDLPAHWDKASLAEPLYELGEWDDVLRITDEVVEWERVGGQSAVGLITPGFAARILAARGDLEAARSIVETTLPRTRALQDPQQLGPALAAAAAVETARGNFDSAVSLVKEFAELTPSVTSVLGYLPEVGRACARAGALEPLERLLATDEDLHPRLDRFVSTARAILAEARGDHDQAEPLYARAEQAWMDYGCIVERTHALLGLGRCRLALDLPADAAGPLNEARGILMQLGAVPLVAEADVLLAETSAVTT